jgi:hypothetical protein
MPFLCPGPPNQVAGAERLAEPGSLEDLCPSYAQARPTKMEAPSGHGGHLVKVVASLMKFE